MIITHTLPWDKCLSHQLMPAIEKGWKDTPMKPIHFFWGLAGRNIPDIAECKRKNEEWWYVDVGYLTEQITRYPEPIINNYDNTYFRICKGNIHTEIMKPGNGDRLKDLSNKGIDTNIEDWKNNNGHILVCPSSPTVTHYINNMTQDDWINQTINKIKEYTNREVRLRNKPRPSNKWWNTDIKDDLKGAHSLVTNMSLSAVDAIKYGIPVFTDIDNIASPVSHKDISNIENTIRPDKLIINDWVNSIVENQFTIKEIEDDIAFKVLQEQI